MNLPTLPNPSPTSLDNFPWQDVCFSLLRQGYPVKDSVRAMAFAYGSRLPMMKRISIGKRRDGLNIMLLEYNEGPLPEGMTNELFMEEGRQFIKMSHALLFDMTREQFYFLASRVRSDIARVEEWCETLELLYERRD